MIPNGNVSLFLSLISVTSYIRPPLMPNRVYGDHDFKKNPPESTLPEDLPNKIQFMVALYTHSLFKCSIEDHKTYTYQI